MPDFGGGADALAQADIKLTNSVLDFARHMEIGRIAPTRVAVEIDYGTQTPEASDILRKIAGASDINATLDSFDPPHEGFRALKRKLAELRNASVGEPNDRIADGQPIKPGAKDPRVPHCAAANLRGDSDVREPAEVVAVTADELVYDAVPRGAQRSGTPTSSRPASSTARPSPPSTGRSPASRSTPCSPTWSAGAGCRATSARPT